MDRILVVDDEPDLVTTYERLLQRKGYRVVSAGSCRDGLEIVRAARRTTPSPTPALVVTGFASETGRSAALAAGASGYLAKPFGAAALLSLVQSTLAGRSSL